jgi:hypothetical protein
MIIMFLSLNNNQNAPLPGNHPVTLYPIVVTIVTITK